MKKTLASILIVLGFTVSTSFVAHAATATFRVVETPTYHLYLGESGTATTMRITPYPVDLDGVKLTMTDFGNNPTLTVDPGFKGSEEIESFTGVTDNGDNTATLTGLTRDLASKYPYTAAGTGRTHGSGAIVVFGNNPQIYGRLAAPENTQTWTATQTYASTTQPGFDIDPGAGYFTNASSSVFVDMAQLTRTALLGCSNSSTSVNGCAQLATAQQAASSTVTGSTAANLVLPASIATSSDDVAGLHVVVTQNSGKINWNQIDLGNSFTSTAQDTFTGGFLDTASSTMTATTSISASSVTGNALILNGAKLAFPSTQCANNTGWIWNGSGTASCGVTPTARYVFGTTTAITAINGNISTLFDSFPAGSITASSTITFQGDINCSSSSGTPNCGFILEDSAGNSYLTVTAATPSAGTCVFPFNATIAATSTTGQISDAAVVSNCASANAFHDNSSAATTFFNTSSITGYKLVLTSSNVAMTTTLSNLIIVVNP